MTRKRKVFYPPSRSSKGPAPVPQPIITPATVARINVTAGRGKDEIVVGMRVTLVGTGLYAGETAVVESLAGGVIPAAVVRTEAGRTRHVRTIDLAPAARVAAPAPAQAPLAPDSVSPDQP